MHARSTVLTGLVLAGLAGLTAAAPAAPAPGTRQASDFEWSGRLERGQTLEVRGINGSVRASRASGGEVEVTASKHGRRCDPSEVRIEVTKTSEGVIICALYPTRDGDETPDCSSRGSRDHGSNRDCDVSVSFVVRLPAGVDLAVRQLNGDVEAQDLESDVDLGTVNGSVRVSTSGSASVSTVNGNVEASTGREQWEGAQDFHTVNGRVTVTLPPRVRARVTASTLHGNIDSDFPLTVSGRVMGRSLSGRIGDGGGDLRVETVNGDVELRASGAH